LPSILALEKEVENQARQLQEQQGQIIQKNRQLQSLMVRYNGHLISQDILIMNTNSILLLLHAENVKNNTATPCLANFTLLSTHNMHLHNYIKSC
jgi:hypothetical protein